MAKLPLGEETKRKAQYWTDVGVDLVDTLGDLRGAAMKLGQLASQYADVLPPQLAEQLRKLQRSVEPLPFERIEPILHAAWTPAQRSRLEHLETRAMAAASIGQVHRARLQGGREVVVKVRYPGVAEAVDADVRQLKRLIGLSKLLPVDDAALDRLMLEVRDRFREETDYAAELRNLLLVRERVASAGIVYPQPFVELCTEGVLVMSHEPGEPLEVAREWSQAQRDQLGEVLNRWALEGYFLGRAVHADPHPGNFAFRPDGQVVVYDFGCVQQVSESVVAGARTLLIAAENEDWKGVHEALIALDGVDAELPLASAAAAYADLKRTILDPLLSGEFFDFADPEYVENIRAVLKRHIRLSLSFKPVPGMTFVVRAASGLYWLQRSLSARVALREPYRRLLALSEPPA